MDPTEKYRNSIEMSFRSLRDGIRDVRDSIGSLSRRSFDVILLGNHRGRCQSSVHQFQDNTLVVQHSQWASLPPELLRDVMKRLEQSESAWPSRKSVVAVAGVCRAWRFMCQEIVLGPELSGKLTFPLSLKLVLSPALAIPSTLSAPLSLFLSRSCSRLPLPISQT